MDISLVDKLRTIEANEELMSCFTLDHTSSWIAIKNQLFSSSLKDVHEEHSHKRGLFSKAGLHFILKSVRNYLRALSYPQERNLFLGASTGLFNHDGQIFDSYFPTLKADPNDVIYMLNSTNFHHLHQMEAFLDEHEVIMENFLIGPLKVILGRLNSEIALRLRNPSLEKAHRQLESHFSISREALYYSHYKFLWGYRLFYLFFKALKIRKAFIVSAYTKSDICAALQRLKVPISEIQHGLMGPNHIGYNYNPSAKGLPVPDELLVYNDFWKNEILRAKSFWPSEKIEIVGRLKYNLVKDNEDLKKNRYLIFTGQGGFYRDLIQFMNDGHEDLLMADLQLYYKPHPRELKKDLEGLRQSVSNLHQVKIYDGAETTESLIKNSLGHISVFSSCHFDAIQFLNKTYILDVLEQNVMNEYSSIYPQHYRKITSLHEVVKEILENA